MSEPVLRAESIGAVRRLTMNRPAKLNVLTRDLVERLSAALADGATDPDVRVVILRGAGRAFCAGFDLDEDAEAGSLDVARPFELDRNPLEASRLSQQRLAEGLGCRAHVGVGGGGVVGDVRYDAADLLARELEPGEHRIGGEHLLILEAGEVLQGGGLVLKGLGRLASELRHAADTLSRMTNVVRRAVEEADLEFVVLRLDDGDADEECLPRSTDPRAAPA
jgi:hypothetical protein